MDAQTLDAIEAASKWPYFDVGAAEVQMLVKEVRRLQAELRKETGIAEPTSTYHTKPMHAESK